MSRESELKRLRLQYEKMVAEALKTFTIDEIRLLIQEIETHLVTIEKSSKED